MTSDKINITYANMEKYSTKRNAITINDYREAVESSLLNVPLWGSPIQDSVNG